MEKCSERTERRRHGRRDLRPWSQAALLDRRQTMTIMYQDYIRVRLEKGWSKTGVGAGVKVGWN